MRLSSAPSLVCVSPPRVRGSLVLQLPISRAIEGRRRMRGFALMGVVWAASLLAVWAAGAWTTETVAFAVLAGAMLVFAIGECLHGAIQAPLAVDLAPPNLVGRYLALSSSIGSGRGFGEAASRVYGDRDAGRASRPCVGLRTGP